MPDVFPPGAPTVAGQLITIEQWLAQPARVQRAIQDLTAQRFIADRIFSPGPPATGGAVIYDQVLSNDYLYGGSRDVQSIAPGSEFPLLDVGDLSPLVAQTVKWGGAALLTYEERDRDRRDQLARKLTRLRNSIVRKVDSVAIATLRAAPVITQAASGLWTTAATDIFADVATAITTVDRQDMGYELDSAIISPNTALAMLKNTTLRSALPRENQGSPNPVLVGRLAGVAGITNWYKTNRVLDQEVFLFSGQSAGSISDEKPLYSRVVDIEERETLLIMAARLTVPYVTDPKSVVQITGVAP